MLRTKAIEPTYLTGYRIGGYASVFGVRDSHGDIVEKGAFTASLSKWNADRRLSPIYLFSDHNKDKGYLPIGKITDLREDDYGLWMEAELTPDNQTVEAIKSEGFEGYGLSIGYFTEISRKEGSTRYLEQLDLIEISLVETASNPDAFISEVKNTSKLELDREQLVELIAVMEKLR